MTKTKQDHRHVHSSARQAENANILGCLAFYCIRITH